MNGEVFILSNTPCFDVPIYYICNDKANLLALMFIIYNIEIEIDGTHKLN